MKHIPPIVMMFLLGGCAATAETQPATETSACREHFIALDRQVEQAGVRDQGPTKVPGFPYLRVNRFLASFRNELDTVPRFNAWVARLATLDEVARKHELTALRLPDNEQVLTYTNQCRDRLIRIELSSDENRQLLQKQALITDDYVTAWRVFGLYPLTALFVKIGIAKWHKEERAIYALPLHNLPQQGQWQLWTSTPVPRLNAAEVSELLAATSNNPLAIPEPRPHQRDQLFATFAPQWSIDTVDENDLPGTPRYANDSLYVDTSQPILYRRLSHTRFNGQVLLQLNYIIWFPARPPTGSWDIYAGMFDGINFRVTLGTDGRPLLFDSIHNCGCYHRLFPVAPLQLNPDALSFWSETPLVPQQITHTGPVPVLHIASRTHFIQRLSFTDQPEGKSYQWDDYDRLRSLPKPDGGTRSLFGQHALIPESKRPERFILWPMGIRSPGAMRQWGHHPTAFVGRRHFDDPHLLDTLFIRKNKDQP